MSRLERFTTLLDKLGYELSPLAWQVSDIDMDDDQFEEFVGIMDRGRQQA